MMFATVTPFENRLFDEIRRMEQDMEELLSSVRATGIRSVGRGAFPALNVGATSDTVNVYLFAPGVDPKSLDVSIQQNLLTVSGERPANQVEGADYYRQERFNGSFRRVITLPDDVDPERVDARYRNGVLHIAVQRRETVKPRQITVQ